MYAGERDHACLFNKDFQKREREQGIINMADAPFGVKMSKATISKICKKV